MEAFRLQQIIMNLQNILFSRLYDHDSGYTYNTFVDNRLLYSMFNFYQSTNNGMQPYYLCIDPFTFERCFDNNDPDLSYSDGRYYYQGGVEVVFTPKYFGFFETNPEV